jgi:hypothetical protein
MQQDGAADPDHDAAFDVSYPNLPAAPYQGRRAFFVQRRIKIVIIETSDNR